MDRKDDRPPEIVKSGVIEPALGQTSNQRHLTAFEANLVKAALLKEPTGKV